MVISSINTPKANQCGRLWPNVDQRNLFQNISLLLYFLWKWWPFMAYITNIYLHFIKKGEFLINHFNTVVYTLTVLWYILFLLNMHRMVHLDKTFPWQKIFSKFQCPIILPIANLASTENFDPKAHPVQGKPWGQIDLPHWKPKVL